MYWRKSTARWLNRAAQKNDALSRRLKVCDRTKSCGSYLPQLACSKGAGSLIVRLADRRPVDRHLVFPARASGVHVPLCRDRAVRFVRERRVCSVGLDFVVCPWCLSVLFSLIFGSFALRDSAFHSNRREKRFGLKHTVGLADGCPIRQNPIICLQLVFSSVAQVSDTIVCCFDLSVLLGDNFSYRRWETVI